MRRLRSILFVLGVGVVATVLVGAVFHRQPAVRIVATAQIDGQLEGCDCGDGSVAGLIKLAAPLRAFRGHAVPTLLVDTGNFTGPSEEPEVTRAMLEIAQELGYAAIALGDQEFSDGIAAVLEYATEYPVGSENVAIRGADDRWYQPKPVAPPDVQGTSIDLITLTSAATFERYPETLRSRLRVDDPVAHLLTRGDGGHELTVVVYHGTLEEARDLADRVSWIDVVIYGRNSPHNVTATSGGQALVTAGNAGNTAAVVDVRRRFNGGWKANVDVLEVNYYDQGDDPGAAERAAMVGICDE